MKNQRKNCLLFFVFLFDSFLYSHGFHPSTIIHCSNNDEVKTIEHIVLNVKKNKKSYVKSYAQDIDKYVEKSVQAARLAQISCYCIISLSENQHEDIVCSPMQNFYRISDDAWISAQDLVVGDKLLCKNNSFVYVSAIRTMQESLVAYMIEVEETHTFLVGSHAVVAHNFIVPAVAVGMSIPFGCGGGAAAGSFLVLLALLVV